MAKKKETIEIPLNLARLLTAEPEDMKDGTKYEDVQALAKSMLRVLMEASK